MEKELLNYIINIDFQSGSFLIINFSVRQLFLSIKNKLNGNVVNFVLENHTEFIMFMKMIKSKKKNMIMVVVL